jgi:hypothetical protein
MQKLLVRLLACVLVLVACCGAGAALAQSPTDRQIKAAFLLRFADYVQWPASAFAASDSPLVIGVVGDEAMAAEIQSLASTRSIRGHRVAVRTFREREVPGGVHVLFVTAAAFSQARPPSGPVLVVTDAEDGLDHGSVINFVFVERRVRFEVSIAAAEARGLSLGSGLLSVALNVRKDSMTQPVVLSLAGALWTK